MKEYFIHLWKTKNKNVKMTINGKPVTFDITGEESNFVIHGVEND